MTSVRELFITEDPVRNHVLTCVDHTGRAGWRAPQGGSFPSGADLWVYNGNTLAPNPLAPSAASPSNFVAPFPAQSTESDGSFFMLDYSKYAFYAGLTNTGVWGNSERGIGSVNLGENCATRGDNSVSLGGPSNVSDAPNSTTVGNNNQVLDTSQYSQAIGGQTNLVQTASTFGTVLNSEEAIINSSNRALIANTSGGSNINVGNTPGFNAILSGKTNLMVGSGGLDLGYNSIVNGESNQIQSNGRDALNNTILNGSNCAIRDSTYCTLLNGTATTISLSNFCTASGDNVNINSSTHTTAMGLNVTATLTNHSFAYGQDVVLTGTNSFAFGDGTTSLNADKDNTFNIMAANGVRFQTNGLVVTDTISGADVATLIPSGSSQATFVSTSRGVVFPNVINSLAVTGPIDGLVIYDSATNKLRCYSGITWHDLF